MYNELHIACYNNNIELVKSLLDKNKIDINEVDDDNRTPLFIACLLNNIDIVKLLLNQNKIDINKSPRFNITPLYIASNMGCTEITKLLLISNAIYDNINFIIDNDLIKLYHKNPIKAKIQFKKDLNIPFTESDIYTLINFYDYKFLKMNI